MLQKQKWRASALLQHVPLTKPFSGRSVQTASVLFSVAGGGEATPNPPPEVHAFTSFTTPVSVSSVPPLLELSPVLETAKDSADAHRQY